MLIIIIQFTHFKINGYTCTKNFLLLVFYFPKMRYHPPVWRNGISLSPSLLRAWSLSWGAGWTQGDHFEVDYCGA